MPHNRQWIARMLCIVIFFCTCISVQGQTIYPYQDIKLEKPSDYPETEPLALSAATFLLTTSFSADDVNRKNALGFLTNWMTGTKDYSFYREGVAQVIYDEEGLLSLFVAAMVKYSIEHKTEKPTALVVEKNACKMVLAYCDNAANNYKVKKKFRKKLEDNI